MSVIIGVTRIASFSLIKLNIKLSLKDFNS